MPHNHITAHIQLKIAGSHNSTKTQAPTVFLCFVTLTYDPKINGFPGLTVEYSYVVW